MIRAIPPRLEHGRQQGAPHGTLAAPAEVDARNVQARQAVPPHLLSVIAGQQGSTRWPAAGRVVELREPQPACGQRVQVRRGNLAAVAAGIREAHIVGEDDDDVGTFGIRGKGLPAEDADYRRDGHKRSHGWSPRFFRDSRLLQGNNLATDREQPDVRVTFHRSIFAQGDPRLLAGGRIQSGVHELARPAPCPSKALRRWSRRSCRPARLRFRRCSASPVRRRQTRHVSRSITPIASSPTLTIQLTWKKAKLTRVRSSGRTTACSYNSSRATPAIPHQ